MAPHTHTTLAQFLRQQERRTPGATGEFTLLMTDLMLACRMINYEVNRAGLADILGDAGTTNVQQEAQKKLDIIAHDLMHRVLSLGGQTCVLASEEAEDMLPLNALQGKYVVLTDPLDGSSNIDVNIPIGTIFSIYPRVSPLGTPPTLADCLQPGHRQLAAGYVLYGSSTVLVFTTGRGVHAFTHDPGLGEFFLTHAELQMPRQASYYSVNDSERASFAPGLQEYLAQIPQRQKAGEKLAPRYVGSLVADFHRNLLKGGIFLYPATAKAPQGKLRLLYECNPIAMLAEQAGGSATDGQMRILDLQPQALHQRTPFCVGSADEVAQLQAQLQAPAH